MSFSVERHIRRTEQRFREGQFDAALFSAKKWATHDPNSPLPYFWQGRCLERLGQLETADVALREGLKRDPHNPECLSMLARCEVAQGRQREAWELARQAEQHNSRNPATWETIGIVYGWVNEFEDAVRVFKKVRELQPDNSSNLINLAGMLNNCHDVEAAEETYRKALELEPNRFIVYWSLSQLRKQSRENNHVDMLQHRLEQYAGEPDAQLYLNLALAKEFEDLERHAESFTHLAAGMSERRRRIDYRTDDDRLMFDTIKRTFSQEFCQAPSLHEENNEAIFIVGMPRTGSTLLEQLIAADADVFAAGELHSFFAAWLQQIKPSLSHFTPVEIIAGGARLDFGRLGRDYIDSTRPRTGRTARFIDKLPDNFLYIGAILKALPNARIIHMARNPMDTCYAVYKQLFARNAHAYSYDQNELGQRFLMYRELMEHWQQCYPGAIHTVHYESLVQNTSDVMQSVFDFLGLQWNENYLDYRKNRQAVGTASTAQVRQAVYRSSVEKWRHYEVQLRPLKQELQAAGLVEAAKP